MLVTMKSLLDHAHQHTYAVLAMNSINIEMIRAGIEAAVEEYAPIIIQMGPGQIAKHAHLDALLPAFFALANKASVPIALNLDHGALLEDELMALRSGFTNVMIDASSLAFEENIQRTQTIVSLAHPLGISVEAELGHVGQAVDGDGQTDDFYTNVEQAKEFVARTQVDALAVAIGTAHGKYPAGYIPKLDFERLQELKEALDMPLVMHGGSGSGEDNVRRAVAGGINKINVCTDAFQAAKTGMQKLLVQNPAADFLALQIQAEASIKQFVKAYMQLIGSSNRYVYAAFNSSSKE
ncbi:class II fructose-bisphosphate aldolase [Collinsella sp. zg1085]|uniref:class II fructose-bisphosphate aldolase n=1 Tax=Collinsella sp. zg1085 TaxID=2844380 RepID=UPI001C0E6CE4|nr:class II fructose-bisphosphate aldolase [Collinsella sp. zg1085]QWT17418.1 class II fructose-bisphosphate aldolase [Collinsella sp. zg1085]